MQRLWLDDSLHYIFIVHMGAPGKNKVGQHLLYM